MAYLVLLKLGLISATVKDVPGRSYPEVTIHSVTPLGKKTYENQTNYKEKASAQIHHMFKLLRALFKKI